MIIVIYYHHTTPGTKAPSAGVVKNYDSTTTTYVVYACWSGREYGDTYPRLLSLTHTLTHKLHIHVKGLRIFLFESMCVSHTINCTGIGLCAILEMVK